MRVASRADYLVENGPGSISGINIDTLILKEVRIEGAGKDLSEEADGLLPELLRVSDVAEGDSIEGVIYMSHNIPVFPFFISFFMLFARVGTTPLTAYSASLTLELTSVQK